MVDFHRQEPKQVATTQKKNPSKYKTNKCEKLIAHCAVLLGWEAMSQRKIKHLPVPQCRKTDASLEKNHIQHIPRLVKKTICVLL